MANSYKTLKEDFVSNLTGGSINEINAVTTVAPAAVILWSVLQHRLSYFAPYTLPSFLMDFLLNCGAILFATTSYSSNPLLLSTRLVSPAVLICLVSTPATSRHKKAKPPIPNKTQGREGGGSGGTESVEGGDLFPRKAFLTVYRGSMMVITCIAILAVDFKVFPRRFAKVENWGTSLMDLGVGSFVFSAGIVGAGPVLKGQYSGRRTTLGSRLYAAARHSLPLLILGLIRLYSVKGLDYAEHVTEYGVHWNFFFTLGLLPPFVAVFQSLFAYIPSYALLSFLLGITYEILLDFTSLKAYILTAKRTDLLSQNREGVFSFFGYLAIFLAGQATGMYVLPRNYSGWEFLRRKFGGNDTSERLQRRTLLFTLLGWSTLWILLFELSTHLSFGLGLQVSRRLANLPYFLWVTAFNTTQLSLFCLIESYFFPLPPTSKASPTTESQHYNTAVSKVLHAFNRNGLPIFLLANLLTGLVNLTLRTLDYTPLQAIGVLGGYTALLAAVAVGLDVYDISIKL
ncbi:MAG: Glucosaminyl phosphatidylinositol (GlcN-PI) nositol acylation protein [Trichoglossum hirsutum]|nr:MAG: Glucosaminyl phosphatidylinositol (GlcN-PI) nositol acylation protein [Trichoglossum hirsutum]